MIERIAPVREKAFGIPYWLLKLSHTSRIWLLYVAGCLLASYACEDISTRDIFLSLSASPGIVTICCVLALCNLHGKHMFPFSVEVDVSNLTGPNMIKGCCFYSPNIFMCRRIGPHAFHPCLSTEE